MAHAAIKSYCIMAVLAVVFLALPSTASSSSRTASVGAALQRVEMAAMYTAQDLQANTEEIKGGEDDVSTTGFGSESEREVPTGPDPIHHHGRGPRRQSP